MAVSEWAGGEMRGRAVIKEHLGARQMAVNMAVSLVSGNTKTLAAG